LTHQLSAAVGDPRLKDVELNFIKVDSVEVLGPVPFSNQLLILVLELDILV
jgi:hypothetical protein